MTNKLWWLLAAGVLAWVGITYAVHFDPFKDSVLFQRLLPLARAKPPMPIDLLANHEALLLSAEHEAEALLKDGFVYENQVGATAQPLLCGRWVFPGDEAARFMRDGSILRGDNFVYVVELYVDDSCGIEKAHGRSGPVPFL